VAVFASLEARYTSHCHADSERPLSAINALARSRRAARLTASAFLWELMKRAVRRAWRQSEMQASLVRRIGRGRFGQLGSGKGLRR